MEEQGQQGSGYLKLILSIIALCTSAPSDLV